MVKSTSHMYVMNDGFEVYEKIWEPDTEPKAQLVLLHGFSDRIDHYDTFFDILLSQYPIRVIGWDRKGWGRSVHKPNQRGNTGTKEQQMAEVNEFLDHVISTIPNLQATPLFVLGHSMGGQELAYYMLSTNSPNNDARPNISGIILEGPYIGLDPATQPSTLKVYAGKLACLLIPHFQLKNPVRVEFVSPDVTVQNMYRDDPLCHGIGTLECFRDMLQRESELTALAKKPSTPPQTLEGKLPCPVLWTHGTADKATDYSASKLLYESLEPYQGKPENKVLKTYDGWFHQLHNEPKGCKEQYARDVGDWIMKTAA